MNTKEMNENWDKTLDEEINSKITWTKQAKLANSSSAFFGNPSQNSQRSRYTSNSKLISSSMFKTIARGKKPYL